MSEQSELRRNYERAVRQRDALFSRIKTGMSETMQAQLDAATAEVIRWRSKLVEAGEWEGPRVIPVKAKYRRN